MNKQNNFLTTILDFFYTLFKGKNNDIKNVRRVYFGLNFRLVTLVSLLLLVLVANTTLILYFHQKKTLLDEKRQQTDDLARTLGELFESFIDKDIDTTKQERLQKLRSIDQNCKSFQKYNTDIYKIFVTNEKGIIIQSTDTERKEVNSKARASYVDRCLAEKAIVKGYRFEVDDITYEVITYPILISKGYVMDILMDFDTYYEKFHKSKKKAKLKIYRSLWLKYKDILGEDFDPALDNENVKVPINNDIDFLFHKLFIDIMKKKQKSLQKTLKHLWGTRWIYTEKHKIIDAYKDDIPEDAKTAKDTVMENMNLLKQEIENIKLLGSITIMYDLNYLEETIAGELRFFLLVSGITAIIAIIIFALIISFLVKNLKILEKGAQNFGMGDFEKKITIVTNDETGRLSDILNNMAVDIKEKLHMEKFISRSTKSMIKKSTSTDSRIEPGTVKRKELSFIFADVRGFTAFSEKNDAEVVIDTLNFYFDIESKMVRKYKGDIDDYVGDQIMAHFEGRNHKARSIKAAIDIKKGIDTFNNKRTKKGLPVFDVGIGVHSGEVVTGNIGWKSRMDFACVGDAVNTTSRLCSNAKPGQLLVSHEHIAGLEDKFILKNVEPVAAKGKKHMINVYSVTGIKK